MPMKQTHRPGRPPRLWVKPSVGDQLDPGRLALRWSEVAVYAAAAGSEAEANLALTAVLRALENTRAASA